MSDLKSDLIRLGHVKPNLRPNLRAVLSYLDQKAAYEDTVSPERDFYSSGRGKFIMVGQPVRDLQDAVHNLKKPLDEIKRYFRGARISYHLDDNGYDQTLIVRIADSISIREGDHILKRLRRFEGDLFFYVEISESDPVIIRFDLSSLDVDY